MTKPVLILTATITPPKTAGNLKRLDPQQRMIDYRGALEFYIDQMASGVISRIVFCDNSATDLGPLVKLAEERGVAQQIEFMSFYGLDYPPSYNRGYGEFKLLDHVMEHSKIISEVSARDLIWKVTGRYVVRNFAKLLNSVPANVDLYCHCRRIPRPWTELYILAWNKKSHSEILKGVYNKFADLSEPVFYDLLARNIFSSNIVRRFKNIPVIEGVRGYDGRTYESMKLKLVLRRAVNACLPWVWI